MDILIAFTSLAFLQHALIAGVLSSVVCGCIGPFVVVRRISHIAGGIAHSVFGGMGAAYYCGLSPLWGALASALLAAIIISWVNAHYKEKEDTIISALWAVGMATGIIFIYKTPGYAADLMTYLFGNILMVNSSDLVVLALLTMLVVAVVAALYKPLLATCFDEEFARLRGVPINLYKFILFTLVAFTVVILMQLVGMILVIALLVIPSAIARQHIKTFGKLIVAAIMLGVIFTFSGLIAAYQLDLPVGAVVILVAGIVFFMDFVALAYFKKLR